MTSGLVFFDDLPEPPGMMPLFRYRRLVTDRDAARKDAARTELERLAALTADDRAWLTANGLDLQQLEWKCRGELFFETCYG